MQAAVRLYVNKMAVMAVMILMALLASLWKLLFIDRVAYRATTGVRSFRIIPATSR